MKNKLGDTLFGKGNIFHFCEMSWRQFEYVFSLYIRA